MAHPTLFAGFAVHIIMQSKKALINNSALILAYFNLIVKVCTVVLGYTRNMQVLQSQFIGKPIMGVHTGEQLCVITGFVIHPDNLKIILFIAHATLQKKPYYLLPTSIRFSDSKRLIIDSAQNLSEFDELVRYQNDILNNYTPKGKKVITQSGKKLGVVDDFSFDSQHNFVQKIYVKANLFKRFLQQQFIIERNLIVETTKQTIIVKDAVSEIHSSLRTPIADESTAKSLAHPIKKSPN